MNLFLPCFTVFIKHFLGNSAVGLHRAKNKRMVYFQTRSAKCHLVDESIQRMLLGSEAPWSVDYFRGSLGDLLRLQETCNAESWDLHSYLWLHL